AGGAATDNENIKVLGGGHGGPVGGEEYLMDNLRFAAHEWNFIVARGS
ncbi:MAG: hypothetical protein RLZZ602_1827, partial [Pseudomonadota bacterium]